MRINNRELFSIEEIDNYTDLFTDKLTECNNKITQLDLDIAKREAEEDACIEVDILSGTATSRKNLSDCQGRKENLQTQRNTEVKKIAKIHEIMAKGIEGLVVKADKILREDMAVYQEEVEKEIYRKLGQLREQQELLLLTLQVAHNDIVNKLVNYDEVIDLFNLPSRYKRSASNLIFHNNLHMAHRSYPEFGVPIIDIYNLPAIEERLSRIWADSNSQANINRAKEDKIAIPQPKKLKDIDLQEFIDNLTSK